jgi:SMC interacting uncharacterized protein involved in chromosome segregation
MTDIVDRLRTLNADFLHEEAADDIERLRAERDRLRDTLKRKQAMTDIVERLRFMGDNEPGCDPSITEEAAAEIERLRVERDDLKADYMRRHIDACERAERIRQLEAERDQLKDTLNIIPKIDTLMKWRQAYEASAERDVHRNKVEDQILRREKAMLFTGTVMIVTFFVVLFSYFFGLIGSPQETQP